MRATAVVQFGLARMPRWWAASAALISGMTSGTAGSWRKAEELSTTVAPAATARGAHSRATPAPALKSATSTPSKLSGPSSRMARRSPSNPTVVPAERAEPSRVNFPTGNPRRRSTSSNSWPTAPLAPTMATCLGGRRGFMLSTCGWGGMPLCTVSPADATRPRTPAAPARVRRRADPRSPRPRQRPGRPSLPREHFAFRSRHGARQLPHAPGPLPRRRKVRRGRAAWHRVPRPGARRGRGPDRRPRPARRPTSILTRILWLEGLEPHNANTRERYIYLHGTNHEARLGQPASHGCVRLGNADVAELFELVPTGAELTIEET